MKNLRLPAYCPSRRKIIGNLMQDQILREFCIMDNKANFQISVGSERTSAFVLVDKSLF